MHINFKHLSVFLLGFLMFASCVDKDFDEPVPNGTDPDITPTMTIAELKALHTIGQFEDVPKEAIISGIVTADDRSGNFYKTLVIEDETAAIELRIDRTNLYTLYPIGRRVFIDASFGGLTLGDYNGTSQIGLGYQRDGAGNIEEIGRISDEFLDRYMTPGMWNQHRTPTVKRIDQLTPADVSRFIRLEDMQFLPSDYNKFAIDSTTIDGIRIQRSLNQTMLSCSGDLGIDMRTSGFASFANAELPTGKGTADGLYTVFGETKQFVVRNPTDLDMPDEGCLQPGSAQPISVIRALYSGSDVDLTAGTIIKGRVTSDRAGMNINNQNMVVQDATAGITVRFTSTNSTFNLGDVVEIDLSGATVSDFRDLVQVTNVDILKAKKISEDIAADPQEVTIGDIVASPAAFESELVTIKSANFSGGSNWGDGTVADDGTGNIQVFTFFSATFSNESVPSNSDITAIVGVNDGNLQLSMRNETDYKGGTTGGDETVITIQSVRDEFSGTETTLGNKLAIVGRVISDRANGNVNSRNVVIQDATAGIVVRLNDDNTSVNMGDVVRIVVSNTTLGEFKGLLQVSNLSASNISNSSENVSISPQTLTINEINSNLKSYESELVKITDVNISGGSTWAGTLTFDDGTGSVPHYTANGASFANDAVPTTSDIIAIVSNFDGPQLSMRNKNDYEGGSTGGGVTSINEDFSSTTVNDPVNINGWTSVATNGTRDWIGKEFDGNGYAQATSYNSAESNDMYLITPKIAFSGSNTLSFETAKAFHNHDGLTVLISTDYDGSNVTSATWTELSATLANAGSDDHAFIPSGNIDLSAYSGDGYIAFRYQGSDPNETTSFRVDNVVLQ